MDEFCLVKEGFRPIFLRKVEVWDGSYYYEELAHLTMTPPTGWIERWEKSKFSNEAVEWHIEKYAVGEEERIAAKKRAFERGV